MKYKRRKGKEVSLLVLTCFLAGSFAAAIAGSVLGGPSVSLVLNTSQSSLSFDFTSNVLDDTAGSPSNPELLIDANDVGHLVWLADISGDYQLMYRKTTASIDSLNGWANWDTPVVLSNVNLTYTATILSAALSSNGSVVVLFSNSTSAPSGGVWDVDINLWYPQNGSVTTIDSSSVSWTTFNANNSVFLRGACGKIMFDGSGNRHIAWNNGTHLMYKLNSGGTEIIDGGIGDVMSEFDMVSISSTIRFVYSMGTGVVPADKDVYSLGGTSGSWGSASMVHPSNSIEDTRPSAAVDPNGNLLMTWSSRVNNASHNYIIRFKNATSGTVTDISTNIGSLPSSGVQTSFNSEIIFYQGSMNIIHTDGSNVANSGTDIDIIWRRYANPSNLNAFSYTVLSGNSSDDLFHSSAITSVDDMVICWSSDNYQMRMARVDMVNPSVAVTSPAGITSGGDAISMALPDSLTINYTVTEGDVGIVFRWGSETITSGTTHVGHDYSTVIPAASLKRGETIFTISVVDELGNSYEFTGKVNLTALPFGLVLTLILSLAIGVPVVLIFTYLYKNRAKLERKKVELSLGGKKKESESWDDEAPIEEDEADSTLDGDTKIDLKKVDMD
ncbi:MAG: hypothetical protein ACTSU9_15865 [Promethearchaeota archaeon]